MRIQPFHDPRTATLSYVVADEESRLALVIDPVADFDPRNARLSHASCEAMARWIDEQRLAVPWVLDTHAHADHFSGMPFFRARYGAQGAIGRAITRVQVTVRGLYGLGDALPCDGRQWDRLLEDGDVLEAGALRLDALHTPGHTPACMTYRIGEALFVGDVLFTPDYGTARCDFPGGSAEQLFDSIQRLYALPEHLRVHAGHDYRPGGRPLRFAATIAEHRRANVQIVADTKRGDYVQFRKRRDATLPLPELMLAALQVNARAGALPEPEKDGGVYLRIPLDQL